MAQTGPQLQPALAPTRTALPIVVVPLHRARATRPLRSPARCVRDAVAAAVEAVGKVFGGLRTCCGAERVAAGARVCGIVAE